MEFTKDTKELVFNLKTEKTTRAAKYNNVFCRVTIIQNGEPVVSRAGATQVQVDKPVPPPPGQAAAKPNPKPKAIAKAVKPNQPKPKPLTRLQKLRLAAKQRTDAKAQQRAGK